MIIIWYNPDQDQYEKGTMVDYDRLILESDSRDRFDILYEFNQTSIKLAERILKALNVVRINGFKPIGQIA